jgi:drug/metabolite transporter (DMT)-like permease
MHACNPLALGVHMSILGFALVLTAAFCHATWNYFVKRINAGPELVWLFSALSVLIYLPFAVYFGSAVAIFDATQMIFVAVSTALHLGYFLLLQIGYRKGDLSVVYPTARATGPILSTSFAVVFLGETMSPAMAVGGAVIIFGVMMLTGGAKKTSGSAMTSLGFGVSAGLLIGSYTAWDAFAVSSLLIPPLLLDYASSVGRATLLAPMAFKRRELVREIWSTHRLGVLIIAIFNPLAYILVLVALTFTPVVYVAPVRELSVLLTVLMGSFLLREGYLKHRLFWAAIMLMGVMVLATS